MTLETIYYITQIIAVIGVIGSLVVVGLQMSQANKLARNEVSDRIGNAFSDKMETIMSDPELSEIFGRAISGQSEFSQQELARLSLFGSTLMNAIRSIKSAKDQGLLESVSEEGGLRTISWFLSKPAFAKVWRMQQRLNAHDPALFEFMHAEFGKRYPDLIDTIGIDTVSQKDRTEIKAQP